jgi:hypothetical protein
MSNLDCSYRFFLSKEELYPGSEFRVRDDLLTTYLRQLLESHRAPDVTVAWQGGKSTMTGLDFSRETVDPVAQLARPGQRVPGPERYRQDEVGRTVETSPERVRHYLGRPHASGEDRQQ